MGHITAQALAYDPEHPATRGCLTIPESGSGPGVLVLHAWWGLNDTFRNVCTRLAEAGFVAFAPDIYHGKIAQTITEAETLARDLNAQDAQAEIVAAARFLAQQSSTPSLAVIGFSLGAYFALDLANTTPELIEAVVLFYGTGEDQNAQSRARYLGHFAEHDPYEASEQVDALEQALRREGHSVTFYRYPNTGHWFFETDRTQAYDPAAAELAWERTLAFLKRQTED